MTNSILPGTNNVLYQALSIQKDANLASKAQQKDKDPPAFNTILSETIKHHENQGEISSASLSSIQQELMKLIVMTQYQMNSAFFSTFDESDEGNASNDDSMNWMGDMGAGSDEGYVSDDDSMNWMGNMGASYGFDLPVSKIQQPSASIESYPKPVALNDIINQASEIYNVDSDLIQAVIRAESNFDPNSTSSKGAMGLMQLMPETAKELGVENAYNPVENIHAGTRYLKMLIDRYEGNTPLALAAYNWGMGNVERPDSRLPRETQNYITRVNQYYQQAKA